MKQSSVKWDTGKRKEKDGNVKQWRVRWNTGKRKEKDNTRQNGKYQSENQSNGEKIHDRFLKNVHNFTAFQVYNRIYKTREIEWETKSVFIKTTLGTRRHFWRISTSKSRYLSHQRRKVGFFTIFWILLLYARNAQCYTILVWWFSNILPKNITVVRKSGRNLTMIYISEVVQILQSYLHFVWHTCLNKTFQLENFNGWTARYGLFQLVQNQVCHFWHLN